MAFLRETRDLPTLELFSTLWQKLFAQIEHNMGGKTAAEYLARNYFKLVEAQELQKTVGVVPRPGSVGPYQWSGHWRGVL
eukprot:3743462-Prorocentrum_lima.AAC.1